MYDIIECLLFVQTVNGFVHQYQNNIEIGALKTHRWLGEGTADWSRSSYALHHVVIMSERNDEPIKIMFIFDDQWKEWNLPFLLIVHAWYFYPFMSV